MNNKLNAQQRAQLFTLSTSKYQQKLSSKTYEENTTLTWDLPKTRFLSKITLHVSGTFTATHASKTTFTKSYFDRFNAIRRVRFNANNGFTPVDVSANMLSLQNKMNRLTADANDVFALDTLGNTVGSGGESNAIAFTLEIPIALNDRDPVGLLMLQNEQMIANLNIDTAVLEDIMTDTDVVLSEKSITITPVVESFSIPLNSNAVPDFSLIKILNEQAEQIVSTNEMIIKLPVGLTYRKIMLYLASDTVYTPIAHANISEFQLILNQADYPINIPAQHVAFENSKMFNGSLPVGCYAFDFSSQGLPNLGGSRDYLDTERLTELWLKIVFSGLTGTTNYVYTTSEKLGKLKA